MEFLGIFFVSFVVSAVAVFLTRRLGKRRKLFDFPSGLLKMHAEPTTYLGGIGMIIAFSFGILIFVLPRLFDSIPWVIYIFVPLVFAFLFVLHTLIDNDPWKEKLIGWTLRFATVILVIVFFIFAQVPRETQIVLMSLAFAFLFMLYGLIDDIWWKDASKSRPLVKLGLQIVLIAGFVWLFNVPVWSVPLVFVILNSVNTTDGMDGMAATMVLVSLVGIVTVVALMPLTAPVFVPALVLAGSVFGFLIFNFPPASVFMGDSGSYFLGFMMAYFTVRLIGGGSLNEIAGAMLVVGMPVIDLVFVTIARAIGRRSIIRGGRDHLYDLLRMRLDGSELRTLLIYGLIQAIVVFVGVKLFFI